MHFLNLATVLCKFWSGTPFVGLGKIISLLHERVVPKGGWIDWMECGGTRVAVAFHLAAHQKCFGLWKNLKENPHRKIVWRLKSSVLLHLKVNNFYIVHSYVINDYRELYCTMNYQRWLPISPNNFLEFVHRRCREYLNFLWNHVFHFMYCIIHENVSVSP